MSPKARMRAAAAALLALLAGGTLAFGQVSGTFAIFSAETANQNAIAQGSWIPPIATTSSSLVNGGSYDQVQLSWTLGTVPPSGNPITGYSLEYADGGSSGSAGCGSYGSFSNPTSSPVSVTGTNISDWWCFQIHAISASNWTSATTTFTARRLFVPTSTVVFANGNKSGVADNTDTITITFNQAPANPGTIAVQFCTSGKIELGSSACGTAGSIGTISGFTSISSNVSYSTSGSGVAGSTLTITLGGGPSGNPGRDTVTGTGSFTAGSGMTSSGGQQACTASGTCSISTSNGSNF